jgi:uridine phosphorylase
MSETLYLHLRPGDVASRVLLTGDPARVDRIADKMLHRARIVTRNREFVVATGEHRGQQISAVSAGIGAPSTAIAIEELAQVGVRTVARIGTMMGVLAPMGSVVIATGAARHEGTSGWYLPPAYPAIPHYGLVTMLAEAARKNRLDVRPGLTVTHDAFYPLMAPELVERSGSHALDLTEPRKAGALALDMESSLVYVLGMVLGLAAASMCLVTVQAEPFGRLATDVRAALETQLINAALDGLFAFDNR